MTSEEFVKRHWDNTEFIRERDGYHAEPWIFFTDNALYRSFRASSLEKLWELGRKFTEKRIDEIAQIEEEIESLTSVSRSYCQSAKAVQNRIIAREQEALAKLREGMKPFKEEAPHDH
jgi:hypothetical protein